MLETVWTSLVSWLASGILEASWWQIVLYTLAMTHVTMASVTIFLHRAQSHRALDLHAAPAHFFRLWLWLTTGQVTKEWVSIHRKHHAKCEQEEDPHSPVIHGIKKVLLQGAELYRKESKNAETMTKYGHGTPDDWIERNVYSRYSWQGVGLMMIINLALFGIAGLAVWAVQMAWTPITAAGIINGLGHWWGYRNFGCKDASHNISPWGIIIAGEELHNNHHTYPTSAKLSVKPWEFDIGWGYIRMLEMAGLATVKKIPPVAKIESAKSVDMATLHAVIQHRYDVMARYARELKRTARAEAQRLREAHSSSHVGSDMLARVQALRGAKRWMKYDTAMLSDAAKADLTSAANASPHLERLLAMREELRQVWERTNASREQLLEQLSDWCKRAEESGIASLQAMSVRVRSYA
jgi:stearoyl-CoA desaturase (Delta-9 desaturase)